MTLNVFSGLFPHHRGSLCETWLMSKDSAKETRKGKVISYKRKSKRWWALNWELPEGGTPFLAFPHKFGAL